jgi:hypothetical protein
MKTLLSTLPLSAAGAAIAVAGWMSPAFALTVVGNQLWEAGSPGPPPVFGNPVQNSTVLDDNQKKAVSFTTDSRTWSLDSIRLSLLAYESNDNGAIFELRANDNSGDPGSLLLTFANPPAPSSGEVNNFNLTGSFTFNPNTTYWLVLSSSLGDAYNWVKPQLTVAPTSSQGWTYNGYKFLGASEASGGGTGTVWTNSGIFNAFEVNATEITPIPFAFTPIPGLIVSGIIGGIKRSKKSRKAEA